MKYLSEHMKREGFIARDFPQICLILINIISQEFSPKFVLFNKYFNCIIKMAINLCIII
jgi:hypothetical protein